MQRGCGGDRAQHAAGDDQEERLQCPESRDGAWSSAERKAHVQLAAAFEHARRHQTRDIGRRDQHEERNSREHRHKHRAPFPGERRAERSDVNALLYGPCRRQPFSDQPSGRGPSGCAAVAARPRASCSASAAGVTRSGQPGYDFSHESTSRILRRLRLDEEGHQKVHGPSRRRKREAWRHHASDAQSKSGFRIEVDDTAQDVRGALKNVPATCRT